MQWNNYGHYSCSVETNTGKKKGDVSSARSVCGVCGTEMAVSLCGMKLLLSVLLTKKF